MKSDIKESDQLTEFTPYTEVDAPQFNGTHAARPQLPRPQRRLNLVVVGKSGVGKSSLLNYAAGRQVFATGCGDPVTEDYFETVDVSGVIPGVTFSLFDTKGIENSRTDEWTSRIFSEIARRDRSTNMYDWFHTIIFCISAGDKRVEQFELDAIRRLLSRGSVVVALTKKDQATAEQLREIKEYIEQQTGHRVPVVEVCNGAHTRTGDTPPSGLDNLLRAGFIGLWEKVSRTLPHRAVEAALGVDMSLALKPTVPNLLGLMALLDSKYTLFPDAYTAARVAGLRLVDGYKLLKSKKFLMPVYIENVAHQAGAATDTAPGGMVGISWRSSARNTFSIPANVNRAELRYKYYRKALMRWVPRWWSMAYESLESISSGLFKTRFNAFTDAAVAEILDFYYAITGIRRRSLRRDKTDEELDALFSHAETGAWKDTLDSERRRLQAALDDLEHRWFHRQQARLTVQHIYSQLAHRTETVREALAAPAARIEQALETELRAYGQYCLDTDSPIVTALIAKARQKAKEKGAEEIDAESLDMVREAARAAGMSDERLSQLLSQQ